MFGEDSSLHRAKSKPPACQTTEKKESSHLEVESAIFGEVSNPCKLKYLNTQKYQRHINTEQQPRKIFEPDTRIVEEEVQGILDGTFILEISVQVFLCRNNNF
jgi:hypothetical protein